MAPAARPVLAVMGLSLLAGCSALWNLAQAPALGQDLGDLVGTPMHGCRMVGTTRTGFCRTTLSAAAAAAVRHRLGLTAAEAAGTAPGGPGGCPKAAGDRLFVATDPAPRPPQGVTRFVELRLVWRPADGASCVQASYAYG